MIKKRGKQEFIKSYRPFKFSEMYDTFNKESLIKMLYSENRPHVYGFFGTSGGGKTTTARIAAMAINCTDLKGTEPCLECPSCQAIINNCPDIIEVNVAKEGRKVGEIEDLIDTLKYNPRILKNKIVIFDEVHEMGKKAQNALLKVLEEERDNIFFFFCTTETKGAIGTLKRRITGEFNFRSLSDDDKISLFVEVLEKEGFEADTEDVQKVLERTENAPGLVVKAAHNFILGNVDDSEEIFKEDARKMFAKVINGDRNFINDYLLLKKNSENDAEKIRLAASGYFKGCMVRAVTSPAEFKKFTKFVDMIAVQYYGGDADNRLMANLAKCCIISSER